MENVYDVIIVGAGCAGFSAAMYCGRFELKTLVVGEVPGGTIILTDVVENYPGFKKLTGQELADKLMEHALEYKSVSMENDKVQSVEREGEKGDFVVKTAMGEKTFRAKTVIFATGTEWKKLGVPGEKEFTNRGVHYCALCDGPIYKNRILAVVGGGDSSATAVLSLTQWASKVYVIYRGEKIRPEPINYERVMANNKIEIINRTNVVEIRGEKFVNKVVLDKPYNGSNELAVNAVFVEIGHLPLSQLATPLGVKLNSKGEIPIDRDARTNVPGVYAAGDVVDTTFKQAITGAAEGVLAAYSANEYIKNEYGKK